MFGRSNDASVPKVFFGIVIFVVTWSLLIVNVSVYAALVAWAFGVGFADVFLGFAAFAYLAGIPVSILVMLALRHKRWYLDGQRKKLGQHCSFAPGESRGFVSPISNVLGVFFWPFAWVILHERGEETSELLSQWLRR